MSQQSSAIVMFRALVMMVCLIAIPLAALFGTSLPDAFKAMKEGRLPAFIGVAHASTPAANPAEEPPKFEPTGPIVPTGAAAMLAPGGRVDDFGMSQPPKPAAFSSPQPPLAILAAPPVVQDSTPDLPRQGVSGVVPAGYVAPAQPQTSPVTIDAGINAVPRLSCGRWTPMSAPWPKKLSIPLCPFKIPCDNKGPRTICWKRGRAATELSLLLQDVHRRES